jgi:hypothetical protein
MVALWWCEEEGAADERELFVDRVAVSKASSYSPGPRALQLAPHGVCYGDRARVAALARRSRTFFWRRAMVLSVVAGLAATAWLVAGRLDGVAGAQAPDSEQCSPGGLPGSGAAALGCGQLYVARAGDTIWSIAVAYSRGGDPRPLVDELEAEIGGGTLQPGERLTVP